MKKQGRLFAGRFGGVEPITKKDGSAVPGMFEVRVLEDRGDREVTHRASFFAKDRDTDEPSSMQRTLNRYAPKIGDDVVVRFVSRGSVTNGRAYTNDTAISIEPDNDAASQNGGGLHSVADPDVSA